MSTNCPPVSNIPSMSRRFRPLSITCVRPSARGLPGRCGRFRKPALKPGNDSLQSFLRFGLHVVVERVPVRVDADGQRAEVLDAELPQALRHQLLPRDLLDLLDLRGLERGGTADDREIDHPVLAHRLDRVVGEAALAADRTDAVLRTKRLGEAHHARARRRANADLFVLPVCDLPHARRGVQEEGAAQIHRRLHALVEDADLRGAFLLHTAPARSLRISCGSVTGNVTSCTVPGPGPEACPPRTCPGTWSRGMAVSSRRAFIRTPCRSRCRPLRRCAPTRGARPSTGSSP